MAEIPLDEDSIIQEFSKTIKTWEANQQKVNLVEHSRLTFGARAVSSGATIVSQKFKKILAHKGNLC